MAVLFIKRDWEQAVGAHYLEILIPFLALHLSERHHQRNYPLEHTTTNMVIDKSGTSGFLS